MEALLEHVRTTKGLARYEEKVPTGVAPIVGVLYIAEGAVRITGTKTKVCKQVKVTIEGVDNATG